jgi:O-antigen ligase
LSREIRWSVLERVAWALLAFFVFTVPWEKSVWVPGVGTIARTAGMAAFAGGVVAAAARGSIRRLNAALVLAGLFVGWCAATYLWTMDPPATQQRVKTLVELLAMAWLIWDQCRTPERQRVLLRCFVLGSVASSAIAFFRYFTNQQTNYKRYAASGFDPNDFGLILAIALPMALYLGLRERGWVRWFFLATVPVLTAAVFISASRTALIATFVAFTFALWTWRASDIPQRALTAALVAMLALSLFHFGPAPQRKRLATIGTEIRKGNFHNRTRIWKTGLKVLKGHPALGVGAGAYPEAVSPWLGKKDSAGFLVVAHNTFLSVLVETGAAGFAVFGLMLALLAIFVWMMPGVERALWTVTLAVWVTGVSTLTWEHYKPTWLIFSLIMTQWALSGKAHREAK